MPYQWDLNIYRGCQHGCKYCYALYSNNYIKSNNFYSEVSIKTNIVEELEKQLRSPGWKGEIINIGGVTDSYQPIEENYKLMPDILKLLIKYRNPAIISTKSDLALRDYDLISELSRYTYINIASTIISTDHILNKKIEPEAASYKKRFNMLKEFGKTKASTGLHIMPIIPYITDYPENFNSLLDMGKASGIDYVLPGTLYLRGETKISFFNFLKKSFPKKYLQISDIYISGALNNKYKENIYRILNPLIEKYKLSTNYSSPIKEKIKKPEDRYYNRLLF